MGISKVITFIISILWLGYLSSDDPIVVKLETEAKLLPLSISKFSHEASTFDAEYLRKLEKILVFDLNHNGMTTVLDSSKEKSSFYKIELKAVEKSLVAQVLVVKNQGIKIIDPVLLSGDLRFDRHQIHLLADSIFYALFGQQGIASTRLLYTLKTKGIKPNSWLSEVYECDYDGGNPKQITKDEGYCVTPCYIPPKPGFSSGHFFYVCYKNGQPKIYSASLKEGKGKRLSFLRGNQLLPAVSKQRDKVAFINDVTGNPDLFLQPFHPEVGAMGKPHQIFAFPKATQGSPTFSPDGKKIAFVSNKDGSPKIYMMTIPPAGADLKKIKTQLISKTNRENSAPAWSPDGTKLAYSSSTKGVRQIWIYDFDKETEWQLTFGSENKENPTWAPNSLHLVFNSTGISGSELYLVNLNQPNVVKISEGSGEKRFPCWEPRL